MITRYGYDVFFVATAVCIVAACLIILFVEPKALRYSLLALPLILFLLTLNFFRDPDRTVPEGENLVVAPADGKIIQIREVEEPLYLTSRAHLISIFMSPLDVHVNRSPVTGTVGYVQYIPGEFFAAFEDKASEKNEQTVIGIEHPRGKVLFKQIAGFLARRIVNTLRVGETTRKGERFGMIRFGSRVDVFVPRTADVKVRVGQRSVAGETVLAELP